VNEDTTLTKVVALLKVARQQLLDATELEQDGYNVLAHDKLAEFFDDDTVLPHPDQRDVRDETAERFKKRQGVGLPTVGVGTGAARHRINAASWAP
jgi:hypothetical protein